MFMCVYNNKCERGKTLTEAFNNFQDHVGICVSAEDCQFYAITSVEIQVEILPVQIVTKKKND